MYFVVVYRLDVLLSVLFPLSLPCKHTAFTMLPLSNVYRFLNVAGVQSRQNQLNIPLQEILINPNGYLDVICGEIAHFYITNAFRQFNLLML